MEADIRQRMVVCHGSSQRTREAQGSGCSHTQAQKGKAKKDRSEKATSPQAKTANPEATPSEKPGSPAAKICNPQQALGTT